MNIKTNLDWDAKHYRKHSVSQESAALNVIENIKFKGNEKVLDIGCGTGNITSVLAKKANMGEVIGIDPSPKMIQQASAEYAKIPNLSFQQVSAEDFHFDHKFDLITSFFALHWVKNQGKVVKNVREALNRGGKIRFLIISGGDPKIGAIFEKERWKSKIFKPEERFAVVSEDDYHQLLEKFGFIKDCVEVLKIPHTYRTRYDMIQNLMTWVPYATELSKDESLVFAEEIVDNICSEPNQQTNIEMITSILYVEAHV